MPSSASSPTASVNSASSEEVRSMICVPSADAHKRSDLGLYITQPTLFKEYTSTDTIDGASRVIRN